MAMNTNFADPYGPMRDSSHGQLRGLALAGPLLVSDVKEQLGCLLQEANTIGSQAGGRGVQYPRREVAKL